MRIAFVTDIHIGATPQGYQMQPRWIEGTPWLLEQFARRMDELKPDLIIIGGDMVERGISEQINEATSFLGCLSARTLVCLGNHDLTESDSLAQWRVALARLDHVVLADALVELPDCDVIGLNTHWLSPADEPELRWGNGTYPRSAAPQPQLQQLQGWLVRNRQRPAILAMHSQLNGVPAAVCGHDQPFEPPTPTFASAVRQVLTPHSRLRLTLSGHCHVACALKEPTTGRIELTGTSFTESPFQFHLIDLNGDRFQIQTQRIAGTDKPLAQDRLWVCQNSTDQLLRG